MTGNTQKKLSYLVLIAPGLLIYALVVIAPLFYSFGLSFTKWQGFGLPKFIGVDNYIRLFQDAAFLWGLRNNMLIVLVSVFGQLPLGFSLAYILHRRLVRARGFFESMIFFPTVISAVVVGLLFSVFFSPGGVITSLVRAITNNPDYVISIFENKTWAMLPILFVILWMYTGLYLVIYLANLQKIPEEVIEAAIIDGASEGQILFRIILPSMIGILFTTAIFAITGSLKAYDLVWAMTEGGPARYTEVIAIYMLEKGVKYYNFGFGSSISMTTVAISVGLIIILQSVYARFEKKYE